MTRGSRGSAIVLRRKSDSSASSPVRSFSISGSNGMGSSSSPREEQLRVFHHESTLKDTHSSTGANSRNEKGEVSQSRGDVTSDQITSSPREEQQQRQQHVLMLESYSEAEEEEDDEEEYNDLKEGNDEEGEGVTVHSAPVTANNSISRPSSNTRKLLSDGAIAHGGCIFNDGRRRMRLVRRRKYISQYRPRKIVVVGDMHCGKSCLVSSYCLDKYDEEDTYSPTIMRALSADCKIRGKLIDMIVMDTPGRYDYLPLRQMAYKKCDLVMICFALDVPESLEKVREFWIPEVQENAPGIPYMVVGNRRDLRDEIYANWCSCEICQDCHLGCQKGFNTLKRMEADDFLSSTMLSFDQGCALAKEVGAVAYHECSAKFRDNTRTVFECATDMALKKHRRRRRHMMRGPEACIIL